MMRRVTTLSAALAALLAVAPLSAAWAACASTDAACQRAALDRLIVDIRAVSDDFAGKGNSRAAARWQTAIDALQDNGGLSLADARSWLADANTHGWAKGRQWLPQVIAALENLPHLLALETQAQQQQQQPIQQTQPPSLPPDAVTVAEAQGHVTRLTNMGNASAAAQWERVLAALGVTNGATPMTVAEAQAIADRGYGRWQRVVETLTALSVSQVVAQSVQHSPQQQEPPQPQQQAVPQNQQQAQQQQALPAIRPDVPVYSVTGAFEERYEFGTIRTTAEGRVLIVSDGTVVGPVPGSVSPGSLSPSDVPAIDAHNAAWRDKTYERPAYRMSILEDGNDWVAWGYWGSTLWNYEYPVDRSDEHRRFNVGFRATAGLYAGARPANVGGVVGSATYRGEAHGIASVAIGGNRYHRPFEGAPVELKADFGARRIDGSIRFGHFYGKDWLGRNGSLARWPDNGIVALYLKNVPISADGSFDAQGSDFSLRGTKHNGYNGEENLTAYDTSRRKVASLLSGQLAGRFYSPRGSGAPAHAAGHFSVLRYPDLDPHSSSLARINGAFGTKVSRD